MSRPLPALSALLFLGGCFTQHGSGRPETVVRNLDPVSGVDVAGFYDVRVSVGAALDLVEVTCDDDLLAHIVTEVRDGVLFVHTEPGRNLSPRAECHLDVKAGALDEVTVSGSGSVVTEGVSADLRSVRVSGSGRVELDQAIADDVQLDVSGSGSVTVGSLVGRRVDVDVSGSGGVGLSGIADVLDARVSGSGTVDARDLAVLDASAEVSGSGSVALTATDSADVRISGSGSVSVAGGAAVTSDISGSGTLLVEP